MSYCFNLFFLCYKSHVRGRKILYFRSKLGLSYNTIVKRQTEFLPKWQKLLTSLLGIGGRARKTFDGVFLPIYYIVGRRQKRSWECGQSFFRRSLVLKAQKASVFKAFLAFGLGLSEVFGRRLSGVLLPKNEYKKDTLQNTECLIVFNLFPYSYKAVVREQKILYFRSKLGLYYNIL